MKPFKDLKVVELASVLAGPAVGLFFAELGADVTKIENLKTNGDVTRTWKLPIEKEGVSAYYSAINYNKKVLKLDISQSKDFKKLYALLEDTDILITNFKHGDDVKFKLDYQTLSKDFPRLITCGISGFASQVDRVAYDVVVQAESGFMSMNGTPESGPIKMPVALMDILAAHQAKEGVLTALLERHKTNRGCAVTVNLEQSALASLANQATNFLMNNSVAKPMGSLHPNIAPYGEVFACKDDRQVVLAVGSNKQFIALRRILSLEEDARFESNQLRVLNRKELSTYLSKGFLRFNREEMIDKAIAENIPIGAIKKIDEVFDNPISQQMVLEETIEGKLTKRLATVAFSLNK